MKFKKYTSMALATALICSNTVSAIAATGSTQVNLEVINTTVEPEPIAVKVPDELNLVVDETGSIEVKNSMEIENLSESTEIELTELGVSGVNGWQVVDYSDDLSSETSNTKKISMQFNGDGTTSTGQVSLTDGNYNINPEGTLPLDVEVKIPKQDETAKTNIAVINYKFEAVDDEPETPPPVEEDKSTISNNWDSTTKMLPSSTKEVQFNWDSTKEDTHIINIESSNPSIANIQEVQTFADMNYSGQKSYTVEGVGRGTTTITATLDTGETSSFDVNVYEVASDIEIEIPNDGYQVGDDISDSNITVDIPVITPDGGSDTITIKPNIPSTSLEEGRNEIPATGDINGSNVDITIVVTIPADDESTISNNWDSKVKLLPGASKQVQFNWDSTKEDTHIVNIESSNPEIADISDASTFASLDYNGQKSYTVETKSRGTTTITATLDTGETSTFNVNVYEVTGGTSTDDSIEVTPPNVDKGEGETVGTGDITIEIPVTNPDGSDGVIEVTPDIPSTELQPGRNEIEVTVDVNGVTVYVTIIINIEESVEENPSNGLTQTVQEAQAMGVTFSSYEDGLQIDSFENLQFKSEINVPEQIGDFKVLKIGDRAFKNQSNLKKITLPDTIKDIGTASFYKCTNLQNINLSEGLESINTEAFAYCTNLKELYLPSTLNSIAVYAFRGIGTTTNPTLLRINCPVGYDTYNMQRINSFNDANLKIELMDNAELKVMALAYCNLNGDIYIGPNVKVVGTYIFSDTKFNDATLIIDNKFIENDYSRDYNHPLFQLQISNIIISDNITKIGDDSFSNCETLSNITIPDSVTSIGNYTFNNCTSLNNLKLPDTLKTIGTNAFYKCTNLDLNIPEGVTSIGSGAFYKVPHITYNGTASGRPWGADSIN